MIVYSFVAPSPVHSFSSNIKLFFDYVTKNEGFPASTQYLISTICYDAISLTKQSKDVNYCNLALEFGTEPFTGDSARFIVGHWDAHIGA